jgi:hypothetical protein
MASCIEHEASVHCVSSRKSVKQAADHAVVGMDLQVLALNVVTVLGVVKTVRETKHPPAKPTKCWLKNITHA